MSIPDGFNWTLGWGHGERWLCVFADVGWTKLTQPGTGKCFPRENGVLHLPPPALKLLLLILCCIKGFYYMLSSFVIQPPFWGKICSNKQASLLTEGKQSGVNLKPLYFLFYPTTQNSILLSFLFFPFLLIVIFKESGQKKVNNDYGCYKSIRPYSV
jgi:hypothetical protein